jgi:glycosyltransferase involved in cell wall biosynthesis
VGSYQRVRILAWHVHGSWMTSFVQGLHSFLIEAMMIGLPVLALAAAATADAVGPGAGLVSADVDRPARGAARLVVEPEPAEQLGRQGRRHALARFGLQRFLKDWKNAFAQVGDPCEAGPTGAEVLEGAPR